VLRSFIDVVTRQRVSGWAQDDAQPGAPLALLILDNDRLVARILANRFRADLETAGIGDGRHAFQFDFDQPLPPEERHVIRVCREADGVDLARSPVVLGPPPPINAALAQLLGNGPDPTTPEPELDARIQLLIDHVDKTVQALADRRSGRDERREYRDFLERWRRRATTETRAPPRPRALVIDDRLPTPERDGGSVVILSHMRALRRLGFDLTFVPSIDFGHADIKRDALAEQGIACCTAPFYGSIEEVLQRHAQEFDLIYLHRVTNAAKYAELARYHCPRARLIYGVADLHHLRVARQAQVEDRPELAGLAGRLRLLEFAAAALTDAVITHSSEEARLLQTRLPPAKIHIVRWDATPLPVATPFASRSGIAFLGGYSHPPNLDAARWLIAEIMPLVRERDASIDCLLIGTDLPDAMRRACSDGIEAVGPVPELAPIFNRIRLTVAPLAFGAGAKVKVIASLAAGIPCVCSPIAAEGLDLPSAWQTAIGGSAADIADAICRLHADEAANGALGESGLRYIEDQFSAARLDAEMRPVIGPQFAKPAEA
jgi:glycosyltransferase involved in cell wall biosynthesis